MPEAIHYYEIDGWEPFHLVRDPDELASVYGAPRYTEVLEALTRRLVELRASYAVPEVDPVPYVECPLG